MAESRSLLQKSAAFESEVPCVHPEISIASVGPFSRLSLRLRLQEAKNNVAVGGIGLDMPINSCSRAQGLTVSRLGPDEWLAIGPEDTNGDLGREFSAALAGTFHSLVDVSHRQIALAVSGEAARAVINGGCPLDLSDTGFPASSATRTVLGKAEILLIRPDPELSYQIECWRSFAAYVHGFLMDAAREFAHS